MTLDEAIKNTEEVAEEKEKEAKEWHENQVRKCKLIPFPFSEMDYTRENECKQCAKEHRQLTKWLKELKQLREQEPCDDCVSRQKLKEQMIKYGFHAPDMTVIEFVEDLPSVTSQPKTGHWIMTSDYLTTAYGSIDYVKCSCCGEDSLEEGDYCPNCGCRMEGSE